MCQSGAPTPPNAAQLASAQTASNKETAIAQAGLNAVNQIAPGGSSTYQQIGTWSDGTPRYQQTTSLSPTGQQVFDTGQQTQLNLANLARDQSARLGGLLSAEIANPTAKDYSADRQRVEDALFSQLDERSARDQATLETQLANKGIAVGSAAYTRAMDDFNKSRVSNRTSAILNAGQEQNRLASLDDAAFSRALTARNQPINEILALAGQGQVQQPAFASTPQIGIAGTDVAGLANQQYAYQAGNFQNQQQQQNRLLGGLLGLGSSFLISDERAKENIKRVGTTDDGQPIYSYNYKGDPTTQMGLIAQDVRKTKPEAVRKGPDGMLSVNYATALEDA